MQTLEIKSVWDDVYRDNTVFKITGNGMFCDIGILETVRRYQSHNGQGIILAREYNKPRFQEFWENFAYHNKKPEFEVVEEVEPKYLHTTPQERGIVLENEKYFLGCIAKRETPEDTYRFHQFKESGALFLHKESQDIFETFRDHTLPLSEGQTKNVIIARSYTRPLLVEFTENDLESMELISGREPKYTKRGPKTFSEHGVSSQTIYVPELSLE